MLKQLSVSVKWEMEREMTERAMNEMGIFTKSSPQDPEVAKNVKPPSPSRLSRAIAVRVARMNNSDDKEGDGDGSRGDHVVFSAESMETDGSDYVDSPMSTDADD